MGCAAVFVAALDVAAGADAAVDWAKAGVAARAVVVASKAMTRDFKAASLW